MAEIADSGLVTQRLLCQKSPAARTGDRGRMAKAALILLRDQIEDIRRGDVRMHPAAEPAVCRGDDAPAPCQIACDRTNWTTVLGHSRPPGRRRTAQLNPKLSFAARDIGCP